ncbi:MAG: hypothetical protein QMC83_09040 [Thermodesulfovibrionales bacterium]|nr:hypothetical protein [Thermodesulfovibrionales bacterium]
MKIVYIMRKCLSMADLIDFKNILSSIYRWIWDKFAECEDIDFAYPTWRFYNNIIEGKHRTKPSAPEQ